MCALAAAADALLTNALAGRMEAAASVRVTTGADVAKMWFASAHSPGRALAGRQTAPRTRRGPGGASSPGPPRGDSGRRAARPCPRPGPLLAARRPCRGRPSRQSGAAARCCSRGARAATVTSGASGTRRGSCRRQLLRWATPPWCDTRHGGGPAYSWGNAGPSGRRALAGSSCCGFLVLRMKLQRSRRPILACAGPGFSGSVVM